MISKKMVEALNKIEQGYFEGKELSDLIETAYASLYPCSTESRY